MTGIIMDVQLAIRSEKLKVIAKVKKQDGRFTEALMPDREVSAILPRSILLGNSRKAPLSLLETMAPIVSRMTLGRTVRLWEYQENHYCSFLPWKSVTFPAS